MARPIKTGLDYFPHDTDASNDEKLEILRSLYGNDGYVFYFICLERIYRNNNLELLVSDAETMQILAQKILVSAEKLEQMIKTSIKYEIFDPEIYTTRGCLTSSGIKKRAQVVIDKRLRMQDYYNKSKKIAVPISAAETQQNRAETRAESTQSKVKKSKEKKSTVKKSKVIRSTDDIPDWQEPDLNYSSPLNEWLEFKVDKNEGYQSVVSIKKIIKKFPSTHQLQAAVDESIKNNWKGCFAPKDQFSKTSSKFDRNIEIINQSLKQEQTF